jgi:hypothetical protein
MLKTIILIIIFPDTLSYHARSWLLSGKYDPTTIFEIVIIVSVNIPQMAMVGIWIKGLTWLDESLAFISVLLILFFCLLVCIFSGFMLTIKYL